MDSTAIAFHPFYEFIKKTADKLSFSFGVKGCHKRSDKTGGGCAAKKSIYIGKDNFSSVPGSANRC